MLHVIQKVKDNLKKNQLFFSVSKKINIDNEKLRENEIN